MSVSAEFQKALVDLLRADAGVSALVHGAVYDEIPKSRPDLCISIGPSDYHFLDLQCSNLRLQTVQVDIYNRDGRRLVDTRRTVDAVADAVRAATITLPTPYALNNIRVGICRVFHEADGRASRGVVQVEAEIEEI